MFITKEYLNVADECESIANLTDNSNEIVRLRLLQKSAADLADNEAWLKNNYDKALHADDVDPSAGVAPASEEEHVLRCLGAALLMQWNDIPSTIQRQLFDSAGTVGELRNTAALRGQIARFLHRYKNGAQPMEPNHSIAGSDRSAVARWEDEGGAVAHSRSLG